MTIENYCRLYNRFSQSEPPVRFLIQGVLPESGLCVLVGPSQTGKSFFAIRAAACIATGELLGMPRPSENYPLHFGRPTQKGATLYFAGEGQVGIPKRLFDIEKIMADALKVLPPDFHGKLPIIPLLGEYQRLQKDLQLGLIMELINEWRRAYEAYGFPIRLIVIDTLIASFEINDENSNSEMQTIVAALRSFAMAFNCIVMVLSHPAKTHKSVKGNTRGASALVNAADVVLDMKRHGKKRIVTVTKMRDGPTEGKTLTLTFAEKEDATGLIPCADFEVGKSNIERPSKSEKHILEVIREWTPFGDLAQKDIVAAVFETEVAQAKAEGALEPKWSSVQRQVKRVLDRLLKNGVIERDVSDGKELLRLAKAPNENSDDGDH